MAGPSKENDQKKRPKKKSKRKKLTAAAKSCGMFKYRKAGKCLDARDKK